MFQRVSNLSIGDEIIYITNDERTYDKGTIDSINLLDQMIYFSNGKYIYYEYLDIEFWVVTRYNRNKLGYYVQVGDVIKHHGKWKFVKGLSYTMQEYGMIEVLSDSNGNRESFYIYFDVEYEIRLQE